MKEHLEGDCCDYCHRMAHYCTDDEEMFLCGTHARKHIEWEDNKVKE